MKLRHTFAQFIFIAVRRDCSAETEVNFIALAFEQFAADAVSISLNIFAAINDIRNRRDIMAVFFRTAIIRRANCAHTYSQLPGFGAWNYGAVGGLCLSVKTETRTYGDGQRRKIFHKVSLIRGGIRVIW